MNSTLIGEKIKNARNKKNLTQTELADKCHLNIRTIQRVEKEEVSPRSYTLRLINEVLDTEFINESTKDKEEEELIQLRKKFLKRKNIRVISIISSIFFLLMVGLVILPLSRVYNIPKIAWAPFVYLIMLAHIVCITVSWRCPGCGGLLGDVFNTRFCSKCGLKFFD